MSQKKIERNDLIREMRKKGLSYRALANSFNLTVGTVHAILNGRKDRKGGLTNKHVRTPIKNLSTD